MSREMQDPFVIFHSNTFVPNARLTDEVGLDVALMILLPEMTVQLPVPTAGVFAPRLKEDTLQNV